MTMMHEVVSREDWLAARRELLVKEKEFTRLRDRMSEQIRDLPWTRVGKEYRFDTSDGPQSLLGLFGECSQLAVYHFMLGPDWEQGCKSCSFWADNFDGISVHLAHRDVSFVVVSRAPLAKIERFKQRMGWTFRWVSSLESEFNYDFNVSFRKDEVDTGRAMYNYALTSQIGDEMPGASFFCKDGASIYHSYSTYSRGLDILNGAYHWLDHAPRGRDEQDQKFTMQWLRHHDRYPDASP